VASGLEIPWDIAFLPGRSALVTERPGRVRLLTADGRLQLKPVARVPVSAAGEGGLLATNREDVAADVRDLQLTRRGHGTLYDLAVPGYKANLSDVLAAIALVQLDKLGAHAEIRKRQFDRYDEAVAHLTGIRPLERDPRDTHAHHLYVVRIDEEEAGATRDDYQGALGEEGISTSIHFLPVHTLTWYRERFPDQPELPVAERAGREVLSLPLSPAHSDEAVEAVIEALRRVHTRFSR